MGERVETAATPGRDRLRREWWERARDRIQAWQDKHPALAARLAKLRVLAMWLGLVAIVVALIVLPEVRDGFRIWFWAYVLLVLWFLVARTKSISWSMYATWFAVCVPWSVVIALVATSLSRDIPGGVGGAGAGTAIAAVTEESLKLVPLVALALAAPGAVRRFAAVDWLLLGFATGLAFRATEELIRFTVIADRGTSFWTLLFGPDLDDPQSGFSQWGFSLLAGGASTADAGSAGHHAATGLVGAAVGLGIAAWRRARRHSAAGRARSARLWRVSAVLAPLVAWWIAVYDHFGWNARGQPGDWLAADSAAPWIFQASWQWTFDGFGRGWLLVASLIGALLVDSRRLARDPDGHERSGSSVGLPWSPVVLARKWSDALTARRAERDQAAGAATDGARNERRTERDHGAGARAVVRWLAAGVAAACAAVAFAYRDVVVMVAAHSRQPDESRRAAVDRGRAAASVLRDSRVRGYDATAPADTSRTRRRIRLVTVLALAWLLVTALIWAPALAGDIGSSGGGLFWLAGLFDSLADWWGELSLAEQFVIGAAVVGLVMLSGGSLGLGLGVAGATMYGLDKGHGLATFTRDPRAATQDYLNTRSPLGMVIDIGEAVLTFAPANFGGSRAAAGVRQAVAGHATRPHRLAGPVPNSRVPAIHADSGPVSSLDNLYRHHFDDVSEVNRSRFGDPRFSENCTRCVIATDATLDGFPASAMPTREGMPISDISDALGGTWRRVGSYEEIVTTVRSGGVDARAVVYGRRPDGTAHVFNVVNHADLGVVFLDGQTGTFARLEDFATMLILPYR